MGSDIVLNPSQFWLGFLSVCAGISSIGAAAAVLIRAIKAIRKPNDDQNARLTALETRVSEIDTLLNKDGKRLECIEAGNRVMQKAMLALLDHGIDGNNIEQMRKAKTDLQEHLIER